MAPRVEMDSGTEFALEAIRGQIETYTSLVTTQMAEMRKEIAGVGAKLDRHADTERTWQTKADRQLAKLEDMGERVAKLERTVEVHDDLFQQAKGAFVMSKVLWVLVGALASTLVWGYATFVHPDESKSPKHPRTHQPSTPNNPGN